MNFPSIHHSKLTGAARNEMDQINLINQNKPVRKGRFFTHKTDKNGGAGSSISQGSQKSIEHDLSRLSVDQARQSSKPVAYCTELWSDELLPRVEAKPFGVPNLRKVLYIQKQVVGRVELLIEVSKTDNGKFYIVVF